MTYLYKDCMIKITEAKSEKMHDGTHRKQCDFIFHGQPTLSVDTTELLKHNNYHVHTKDLHYKDMTAVIVSWDVDKPITEAMCE
jgi:hypothetical protein